MKITFKEEIEAHKAWRDCMCCPVCAGFKYHIHHQLEPYTDEAWWITCDNCGYETDESPTRDAAIARWKHKC